MMQLGNMKKLRDWSPVMINATLDDGIAWLKQLSNELQIKPLRQYGLRTWDFDEIVEQTKKASSTQGIRYS